MLTATWIRNMLDEKGVPYEERHHPEVYTSQAVAQREHVSGHRVVKVVAVMAGGRPYALVLPASRQVRLDQVRQMLGADDARLASEQEMERYFPDCECGALPPLRHWPGIEVIMDEAMQVRGEILFQAGTHSDAVRMRFDDWFELVRPRIGRFSEPAHSWPQQGDFDERGAD